jgi:hypothetical protein
MTIIARLIRILKVMGLMVYLIEYGFIEDLCRLLAGSSSSYHRVPRLGFASPGANTLPPAAQAGITSERNSSFTREKNFRRLQLRSGAIGLRAQRR